MMQSSPFKLDYLVRGQPDLQQPKARNQPQGQVSEASFYITKKRPQLILSYIARCSYEGS